VTNPKGTREETRVTLWLRDHGWPYAKRKPKAGRRDEGDITLGDGVPLAIESKAVKGWNPAGWMKELEEEVANSRSKWGFVVVKKRGTTDAGEYYVVLPLKYLNPLLLKLYKLPQAKRMIARRPG
jgi:hypothetical protein